MANVYATEVDPPDVEQWLVQIAQGDDSVWPDLLGKYGGYLQRVLTVRLDPSLKGRIDIVDLIQETHLRVSNRIEDYLQRRPMPFKLWLRATAVECVIEQYRKHVVVQARSVNREQTFSDQSSLLLARQLVDNMTSPSGRAVKSEERENIRRAVAALSDSDRDILVLRTYEALSNAEASTVLELEQDACRKRYTRALKRLRELLNEAL